MFEISRDALEAINILETAGKRAYLAGGCVRDMVMGKEPHDWDICTSAKPVETEEIFEKAGYKTYPTGIAHGTITVSIGGEPLEITTFRTESGYGDYRHPDGVDFVLEPELDVKRRDFTVNGLLYNPKEGVLDFVGGIEDINKGIIRAIGEPDDRFSEDPLRIMRGMRFSSTLGFEIDPETSESMMSNRRLLMEISQERISEELIKLLMGKDVKYILFKYSSIMEVIIPEIHQMIGFDQNNPHHCYDVWVHTIEAVANSPAVPEIRMAMLLHDIGKPAAHEMDSNGISHFYNHPVRSVEIATPILKYMKFSNDFSETVLKLIQYHDLRFPPREKNIRRVLNNIGEENFRMLIDVKRADMSAQSPYFMEEKMKLVDEMEQTFKEVMAKQQCYSLKTLEINGKDLLDMGVPQGRKIGDILGYILDRVIDGEIPNDRERLLEFAKNRIEE